MTRAEILDCLTDRPCEVCKFHSDGHCSVWNCIFEEEPDDAEDCEDAISRQAVLDGIKELKKSPWATDKRGCGIEHLITEALDVVADLCVKQEPSVTPKQKMCFDGMTNGEVIDSLFQNTDMYHTYHNQNFMLRELVFTDEWWDAPYKAESEDTE